MPVAIETVIIVIVVVSFAVLGAVVFALYWLWRLLLEDRRCNRLGIACRGREHHQPPPTILRTPGPPIPSSDDAGEEPERALLEQRAPARFPRITRRSDVIVDERGRRMREPRGKRERGCSTSRDWRPSPCDLQEVVVIDDTEPPPPYEAMRG